MSGLRLAAAALYGLHRNDREAILSHLAVDQQELLGTALAELEALGFERSIGAALVEDERQKPASGAPAPAASTSAARSDHTDAMVKRLCAMDGERMYQALGGEPPSLIAEVLRAAAWPWHEALLERLPHSAQRDIRDRMFNVVAIAPLRHTWLLDTLCVRVALSAEAPPHAPGRLSIFRRWLAWRA
jgi:hypothetical protein